jgi:molybdate transport system substrate-binding protein
MATRGLMDDLAKSYTQITGVPVSFLATGGVDAARRVLAGEAFDVVVLASDAIDKLIQAGKGASTHRTDLVRSSVGVAVKTGAKQPDISTGDALRHAVLAASRIGYSTGPSGVALIQLFERWGIADQISQRLIQAPPGVPVGSLLARGEVDLGFQQMSELIGMEGIELLGPLSEDVQIQTIFSAVPVLGGTQGDAVQMLLEFMTSHDSSEAKFRHGMEPA